MFDDFLRDFLMLFVSASRPSSNSSSQRVGVRCPVVLMPAVSGLSHCSVLFVEATIVDFQQKGVAFACASRFFVVLWSPNEMEGYLFLQLLNDFPSSPYILGPGSLVCPSRGSFTIFLGSHLRLHPYSNARLLDVAVDVQ